jgi:hypothetical protein
MYRVKHLVNGWAQRFVYFSIVDSSIDLKCSFPNNFWTNGISELFFDFVGEIKLNTTLHFSIITILR